MSEPKQPTPEQIQHARIKHTMQRLMDQGKMMESGWMTYRLAMSPTAPPVQLRECRLAFWQGAAFVFQSLMYSIETGTIETPADMRRIAKLDEELNAFLKHCEQYGKSPHYTCPRCGAISYNATDIKQGYCGACHDWS